MKLKNLLKDDVGKDLIKYLIHRDYMLKSGEDSDNIDLKYDWNNLFFFCSYCNGKKSSKYNDSEENMILDCTKESQDVENRLI